MIEQPVTQNKLVLRNLLGFWLFGFFNSILGYIIFFTSGYSEINSFLLLAVPSCVFKVLPLFLSGYLRSQVIVLSSLHIVSSILFGFAYYFNLQLFIYLSLFITLLATGFGEVYFLSYSSGYDRRVIPAWTSGRGASGIIAILIWNKSRTLGAILPIMSIPVAIINLYVFFFLIKSPIMIRSDSINDDQDHALVGMKSKITYIPKLFKYMLPLGLAIIFQLIGSQLIFSVRFLNEHKIEDSFDFYYLFHGALCFGFFIAGTFSTLFKLKSIWILTILQFINLIILIVFYVTGGILGNWFISVMMFWTGLIEGCAYVKTFYKIHEEEHQARKKFSLGMTTIVTSLGIIVGAVVSILLAING